MKWLSSWSSLQGLFSLCFDSTFCLYTLPQHQERLPQLCLTAILIFAALADRVLPVLQGLKVLVDASTDEIGDRVAAELLNFVLAQPSTKRVSATAVKCAQKLDRPLLAGTCTPILNTSPSSCVLLSPNLL